MGPMASVRMLVNRSNKGGGTVSVLALEDGLTISTRPDLWRLKITLLYRQTACDLGYLLDRSRAVDPTQYAPPNIGYGDGSTLCFARIGNSKDSFS